MAGRPTKYSDTTAEIVLQALRAGLTKKDAALVAGVHPDTIDNWAKRNSDFSAKLARAEANRAGQWLSRIEELAAQTRDWRAYESLLDRCAPEYRKAAGVDVTHRGTVTHHHRDLSAFTDEQIAKLAAVAEEVKAGERTP